MWLNYISVHDDVGTQASIKIFFYKCLLAWTRRVMLDAGFFKTMYSIIAVATDNPYLGMFRTRLHPVTNLV